MTMHLEKPHLTTTRYNRKKKALTDKEVSDIRKQWKQHNKLMKRIRQPEMQMDFDQYVKYVRGKHTVKVQKTDKVKPFAESVKKVETVNPEKWTVCIKREENKYTGTYIKGIGVMHKSNAVPITSKEQAKEVSTMRRN